LTGASTGTPSNPEEPRPDPDRIANFADFVVGMTDLLNRQEALKPRNTTKINNTVYTADLTTSHRVLAAQPLDPSERGVRQPHIGRP
jgi:hypothetical protein